MNLEEINYWIITKIYPWILEIYLIISFTYIIILIKDFSKKNKRDLILILILITIFTIIKLKFVTISHFIRNDEFTYFNSAQELFYKKAYELCILGNAFNCQQGKRPFSVAGYSVFLSNFILFKKTVNLELIINYIISIVIIILAYSFFKKNDKEYIVPFFSTSLLTFNPVFLKTTSTGNNETLSLLFLILSITTFFKIINKKQIMIKDKIFFYTATLFYINIRHENILLLISYLLFLRIYKKKQIIKKISMKKINKIGFLFLITNILLLIIPIGFILENYLFVHIHNIVKKENLIAASSIVKYTLLWYGIKSFIRFYNNMKYFLYLKSNLILIIPILTSLFEVIKHKKTKKNLIFFLISSLIFIFGYSVYRDIVIANNLSEYFYDNFRYFLQSTFLIVSLINAMIKEELRYLKANLIKKIIYLSLIIIIIFYVMLSVNNSNYLKLNNRTQQFYSIIKNFTDQLNKKDIIIMQDAWVILTIKPEQQIFDLSLINKKQLKQLIKKTMKNQTRIYLIKDWWWFKKEHFSKTPNEKIILLNKSIKECVTIKPNNTVYEYSLCQIKLK